MVECQLPKLDVAGSIPVSRSKFSLEWTCFTVDLFDPASTPYSMSAALHKKANLTTDAHGFTNLKMVLIEFF